MGLIIDDTETNKIKGDRVVLIGGCFDILHNGHLEFIERSKKEGSTLVVLLESDENIKRMKGKERPLNNQIIRAKNLAKNEYIDYIINLSNPTSSEYYYNLVKSIRPDIIAVTSNDPLLEVKKEQANLVNGKVFEVMQRDTRYSSTDLINKI